MSGTFLRTLSDGNLAWIRIDGRAPGAHATSWRSLVTTGPRTVFFHRGAVIHDGREDETEQTLSVAMAVGLSPKSTDDETEGAEAFLGEADGSAERRRFVECCGESTIWAHVGGLDVELLGMLDMEFGFATVDGFFRRWSLLLDAVIGRLPDDGAPLSEQGEALLGEQRDAAFVLFHSIASRRGFADAAIVTDAVIGFLRERLRGSEDLAGLRRDRIATLLRRMRDVPYADGPHSVARSLHGLLGVLSLASQVAPDWLPGDARSFARMADVARLLHPIVWNSGGAVGYAQLVSSSKGRWGDFSLRLLGRRADVRDMAEAFDEDFDDEIGNPVDVRDMVEAFGRQCALPALLHAAARGDGQGYDAGLRTAIGGALRTADEGDGDGEVTEAGAAFRRACWRMLFLRKAAPAILEDSAAWHKAAPKMAATIDTLDPNEWKAPFPAIEISEGVSLVPIVNSTDLAEEGARLRHCVGGSGYVERCLAGRCVIASIRRRNADGTVVPTSTVELSAWRPGRPYRPSVVQHRGHMNRDPSGDDVHDLSVALTRIAALPARAAERKVNAFRRRGLRFALHDALAEARDMLARAGSAGRGGSTVDPVTRAARYDWMDERSMQAAFAEWGRFLPRHVRAGGVAGFAEHFAKASGEAVLAPIMETVAEVKRRHRPAGPIRIGVLVPGILGRRLTASAPFRRLSALLAPHPMALAVPAAALLLVGNQIWGMASQVETVRPGPLVAQASPMVAAPAGVVAAGGNGAGAVVVVGGGGGGGGSAGGGTTVTWTTTAPIPAMAVSSTSTNAVAVTSTAASMVCGVVPTAGPVPLPSGTISSCIGGTCGAAMPSATVCWNAPTVTTTDAPASQGGASVGSTGGGGSVAVGSSSGSGGVEPAVALDDERAAKLEELVRGSRTYCRYSADGLARRAGPPPAGERWNRCASVADMVVAAGDGGRMSVYLSGKDGLRHVLSTTADGSGGARNTVWGPYNRDVWLAWIDDRLANAMQGSAHVR